MNSVKILRSDKTGHTQNADGPVFSDQYSYGFAYIDLDKAQDSHSIDGFGASFTDAACYMINKLPDTYKTALIKSLFSFDELNLSISRLNIGSSDYATKIYSYADTPNDIELKDFSIEHDKKYILPLIKQVKEFRQDMVFFASPWSPPGWMKLGGSMCGGYLKHKFLPTYAKYLVKYLSAYREEGVDISAITLQNEPDTDQHGKMPACLLHPEYEMELISTIMPMKLKEAGLDTKVWLYDHNFIGWQRVLSMMDFPLVRENIEAVAFHTYEGDSTMMNYIKAKYPNTKFHITESPVAPADKEPGERGYIQASQSISECLNEGSSSYISWNYALDELGRPNVGTFNCVGLVEINSRTGQITPSNQYYALKHFAPYMQRGATLLKPTIVGKLADNVITCSCRNPNGSYVVVLTNASASSTCVQIKLNEKFIRINMTEKSVCTVLITKEGIHIA